jgi:hypothetical protein
MSGPTFNTTKEIHHPFFKQDKPEFDSIGRERPVQGGWYYSFFQLNAMDQPFSEVTPENGEDVLIYLGNKVAAEFEVQEGLIKCLREACNNHPTIPVEHFEWRFLYDTFETENWYTERGRRMPIIGYNRFRLLAEILEKILCLKPY